MYSFNVKAILRNNDAFYHPDFSNDIHYEVEIVLKINKIGKNIDAKFAHKYYEEVGIGIDFTARDIQSKLKEKGLPWEKAKAFNGSAPISNFVPKETIGDLKNLKFDLILYFLILHFWNYLYLLKSLIYHLYLVFSYLWQISWHI